MPTARQLGQLTGLMCKQAVKPLPLKHQPSVGLPANMTAGTRDQDWHDRQARNVPGMSVEEMIATPWTHGRWPAPVYDAPHTSGSGAPWKQAPHTAPSTDPPDSTPYWMYNRGWSRDSVERAKWDRENPGVPFPRERKK